MKGRGFLWGVCLAALAFTCAFVLTTCGGGRQSSAPPVGRGFIPAAPTTNSGDQPPSTHVWVAPPLLGGQAFQAATPSQTTLAEALAELDGLPIPEGVEDELFSQLKSALHEALHQQWGSSTSRSGVSSEFGGAPGLETDSPRRSAKLVSKPPTGEANKVEDLAASKDGDEFILLWHYKNAGDYNQDGIVNIMDITPLAVHFNEEAATENEWIDGNADTAIDIKDITPLAVGFFNTVDHYEVEAAHLDFGPWNFVGSSPLLAVSGERMRLAYDLGTSPAYTFWRVVPVDAEGNRGEPSNVASLAIEQPVEIIAINPLGGVAGSEVTFTATVIGNPPFDFEWDFGGGASPNQSSGVSSQPSAEVTLGTVGQYSASLVVSNAEGSDMKSFTLTVTETPGNPPEILSVTPTEGDSGTEATFTAEVTGDAPLTYQWNFGGGASPNLSTEASPTVTLGRGGTLPEPTRTCPSRLTVSNPSGTAIHDFDLSVTAIWHIEEIPKVPGYEDKEFTFLPDYDLAPDGSLWGVHTYVGIEHAFLIHSSEGGFEYEHLEYDGAYDLKVDRNGNPALAAFTQVDFLQYERYFARKVDGVWEEEVVDFAGKELLFDSGNRPVVVFTRSEGSNRSSLWVARKPGDTWELTQVREAMQGGNRLAVMGDDDRVGIAEDFGEVKGFYYYEETANGWVSELLFGDDPENIGHVSRALASLPGGVTLLLITRHESDTDNVDLILGTKNGSGWEYEEVGSYPNDYSFSPIGLAAVPDGIRVISVYDYETKLFLFFAGIGGTWSAVGQATWNISGYPSLASDPDGHPVILTRQEIAKYW